MIGSKDLDKKYLGKEVICEGHKNARIDEITSYDIKIAADDGHWAYRTGTGYHDNAVARGSIRFADETLQKEFIEDYEEYVSSDDGRIESYGYYMMNYD
ncbi:MAG: hypothetical protein J1G38_02065 [Clostridiales bacterium]|nr:hypothetical protein [Clostridiales bacterium]